MNFIRSGANKSGLHWPIYLVVSCLSKLSPVLAEFGDHRASDKVLAAVREIKLDLYFVLSNCLMGVVRHVVADKDTLRKVLHKFGLH